MLYHNAENGVLAKLLQSLAADANCGMWSRCFPTEDASAGAHHSKSEHGPSPSKLPLLRVTPFTQLSKIRYFASNNT